MQDLEQSVIRIMNMQDRTVGTGFVVADRLAVTCAHVVLAAGSTCDQPIYIQFYSDESKQTAQVLTAGWSQPTTDDVAFLQLDYLPEGVVPLVLGSAKQCQGHPYHTFGFASLAGYDNRQVTDTLDGVVSVRDKHKHSMLQLKGEEIDQGLSGSPILDTQTDRVVGMVSEYQDNKPTRFAWATTVDTLVDLHPALQPWPETYGPRELDLYLHYLIETNQWLKLPDDHEVLLERIYVSLRADEMNAAEWKSEQALYLKDLEAVRRKLRAAGTADQYTEFELVRKVIARHPKVLKLTARDWDRHFSAPSRGLLSLAEVVQRHPHVVILGDPGSGKTTLGKWLVLQYTRALQGHATSTQVLADLVLPGKEADTLLDLGPPRLPTFLRITDYVRARWKKGQDDNRLPLKHFIGKHENKQDLPAELSREAILAITQAYLARGQALVILDGLDEVDNPEQRRAVMREVKRFLQSQAASARQDAWKSNRLLLTSRIVGYQFEPLTDLPHYTVEAMDYTAIAAFCQAWIQSVAAIDDAAVAEEAEKLKDAIFEHAHPGVRILAGNPLLLTLLAQVYWNHPEHRLPATRVALFQETERTFYLQREASWDQANIKPNLLTNALGAVAYYIQTYEPGGFTEEGMVRKQLQNILHDKVQVEEVLHTAREFSGFLVARGEGVYGFLHRGLQEYFVAQFLLSQSDQLVEHLVAHSLDPLWREPMILAVGLLSQPKHSESHRLREVFIALLESPDPVGAFLPRRELLAAVACRECERIFPEIGHRIAYSLLEFYAKRDGCGRVAVVRTRIIKAFMVLHQSVAQSETEAVLCAALQEASVENHHAAVELIMRTGWYTPSVVCALVEAWRVNAEPAAALLTAFAENILKDKIPLLRKEPTRDKSMWNRTYESMEWRRIIDVFHELFDGELSPHQFDDGTLFSQQLAQLDQTSKIGRNSILRPNSLVGQLDDLKASRAVLPIDVLQDAAWAKAYIMEDAGWPEYLLCPLIAALTFPIYLALAIIVSCRNDVSQILPDAYKYLISAESKDFIDFFGYLVSANYNLDTLCKTLGPVVDFNCVTFTREMGIWLNRIQNFDCIDAAKEVNAALGKLDQMKNMQPTQMPQLKGEDGAAFIQQYEAVNTSLATVEKLIDSLEPILRFWIALSMTYQQHRKSLLGTSEVSEITQTHLTADELVTLVDDLSSFNDWRRERARRVLNTNRFASVLGQRLIEQMATLAIVHASSPLTNPHLTWALQAITHDKPEYLRTWIGQVSESVNVTPAERIISLIHNVTPDTFEIITQTLPNAAHRVNIALLSSINWLVRLQRIPQDKQTALQEQLRAWLKEEWDPSVRRSLIEVLGCLQDEEATKVVVISPDQLINYYTEELGSENFTGDWSPWPSINQK